MRKNTIDMVDTSSMMVSFAMSDNFMKLSITKHKPSRFEDFGKI